MTGLSSLWLPILLSSVVVFLVSSLIHMVLPWHKGDYPRIPDEEKVMDALRPLAIPPGDYMVPRPSSRKNMRSPEFLEKMKKGPVMTVTVWPNGMPLMGTTFVFWFLYTAVVGLFAAYVTGRALPPAAESMQVFRFISTVAFVGYTLALCQMPIWYKRGWVLLLKDAVDGLIYSLLSGLVFVWLWP